MAFSTGGRRDSVNRTNQSFVVRQGPFTEKHLQGMLNLLHLSAVLQTPKITFPLVFELLIWLCYVGMYKYSNLVQQAHLPHISHTSFPYPLVGIYGVVITLYLIPYYRWAVPKLLYHKRYKWLLSATVLLLVFFCVYNNAAIAWLFSRFTNGQLHLYFERLSRARFVNFDLLLTDLLAFFCLAFARYSHNNETLRRKIETDHLSLQLGMLKAQLQPHFLFNTLNGLYAMSLAGAAETPRYILLLSQMMQYILYDCDQEQVNLNDELNFMQGYFELEQKKFPGADIKLRVEGSTDGINLPPLLFLPLMENSFKHGRHKITDQALVHATLKVTQRQTIFTIVNDVLPHTSAAAKGGIGLVNLEKRLTLYYPEGKHHLAVTHSPNTYQAVLTIQHA